MNKICIVFSVSYLLCSCATILNEKNYLVLVSSNLDDSKVKVYDSIYKLPALIDVKRSNKDLDLTLLKDSLSINYKTKASLTNTFIYWNMLGYGMYHLIDLTNHKRFHYGKSITLNSNDTVRILESSSRSFWKKSQIEKGDIDFVFSIPLFNNFYFKPENYGARYESGIFGMSLGADYYYKPRKFLNFNITGAIGNSHIGECFDNCETEGLSTLYFSLTDNFNSGNFYMGYGLSYSRNYWSYSRSGFFMDDAEEPVESIYIESHSTSIGMLTNVYFRLSKMVSVGVIYRPDFYRITPTTEFIYEHLISLDLSFKVPVR